MCIIFLVFMQFSEPNQFNLNTFFIEIMQSPKKFMSHGKDSTFIIRKASRPPTGSRISRIRQSPDKKNRDGRKSMCDYLPLCKGLSPSALGLTTSCWCLYDSKNQKELGFRQNYQRQIASLTKIMTTLITIEAIEQYNIKLNLLVKVSDVASKMIGTTANLKQGTWIILKDLLFGVMLPSGNDAAYLLAEIIGFVFSAAQKCENSEIFSTIEKIDLTEENTANYVSEFIRMMNIKADQLQLIHTRFSNPHGLQNAMNVSSAKDIIILSHYASKNRLFRQIVNSQYKRYEYFADQYRSQKQIKRWFNTNALLGKGWEGIKTGQTLTAGCCLSSLKNGVYIVVLNCSDPDKRFSETERIYNWYVQMEEKDQLTLPPIDSNLSPEK